MPNQIKNFQEHLQTFLSPLQIIESPAGKAAYVSEKRGDFISDCALVVLPKNALEITKIIKACQHYKVSIVPQSGNTGLVGGAVSTNEQIIVNVQNMHKILEIDVLNRTITLEAGVTLAKAQLAAAEYGLLFPLNIASRDQAKIGGLLATNAGGLNTLKYGSVKNFTLGLEAVLADGTIISDLNTLNKRNIGPDYKGLFVGGEGILGLITAATFRLYPRPQQQLHLLFSCNTLSAIIESFHKFSEQFTFALSAFEVINNNAVNTVLNEYPDCLFPLEKTANWYGLCTLDFYHSYETSSLQAKNLLKQLEEKHLISQFYTDTNKDIWSFRELLSEAQKLAQTRHNLWNIKNDVAVAVSKLCEFITESVATINNKYNNSTPIIFGHIGDNSLHLNFTVPIKPQLVKETVQKDIQQAINALTVKFAGNFTAEHGVGLLKADEIKKYYSHNQIYMLKLLKQALDPLNLFNPGKIINMN